MGELARKFFKGTDRAEERNSSSGFGEYAVLSDFQKEELCRTLLSEFGVSNITRSTSNGELIHSCCLPFGLHKNGDLNPSASLNYKKLTYSCLGCGNSGGLLWFIGVCRGISSTNARGWLVNYTGAGDPGSLAQLLEFFDAVYTPRKNDKSPIPKFSEKILDNWRFIHPYLTEIRKIPEEVLIQFNVGWNPEKNRIVLPHFWKGNLVGWQTRRLTDDGTPKYLSSVDFPKKQTLYNYQPSEPVVVVESVISVLSKHIVCSRMEATFGMELPDKQVQLLTAHPKVTLFFDNDPAGWKATESVGKKLLPYTDVRVVDNPWSADAADVDKITFLDLVSNAVPFEIWQPPMEVKEWK